MEKQPFYYRLLFSTTLRDKIAVSDVEFQRKASLVVIIFILAIALQIFFSIFDFCQGLPLQGVVNAVVSLLLAGAYLHLRARANLTISVFIIITILCVHFATTSFFTGIDRVMWNYTVPLACFFLLGTRRGALFSAGYLGLLVFSMFFIKPEHFSPDFKARFVGVYFSISLLSYFFERVRCETQEQLKKNRLMLEIQRDVSIAMGEEKEITAALDRVLQILIARLPDIDCGGIYIIENETGKLRLAAHRGLSPGFIKTTSHYPAGTPNAEIVRKGIPVYTTFENLGGSIGIPLDDEQKKENLRAIAVLPVQSKGGLIAVMNCASHQASAIQPELRQILESVVSGIGDALGRMLAEHNLRTLSSRTAAILSAVPDIIMEVDKNNIYTWANMAGVAFFGDDVVGKETHRYFIGEQDTAWKVSSVFEGSEDIVYVESWQRRKDGKKRLLALWCRALKDESGRVCGALSSGRDITDNREMENRLRQAQKMEAIGQLAGGVAHDFNNQLTSIMGFADLIRNSAAAGKNLAQYADGILLSASRSADLTKQLLAFARKGKYQAIRVDLHQIIGEVFTMLQHTLDRKITLKQHLGASPSMVRGDPSQLQNALLNVALNARDAMPDGGEILFSTEGAVLDEAYCKKQPFELSPGHYCVVSVTDTGIGMDDETQKHLFEPFFTTKKEGTGMGLPAVYGIMKVHHGSISIESEPGRGTTVRICMPAFTDGGADMVQEPGTARVYHSPKGLKVLFVDDEDVVRRMATELFKFLGHTVVTCENGLTALEYYQTSWKSIDLVVLDMIMPEMGGKATFAAMKKINPGIKVVLSSGYSLEGEAEQLLREGAAGFIQKPYTAAALAELLAGAMNKK